MLVEDKKLSSLRSAIRRQHMERFNPEIIEKIVEQRVFFKWLPVTYVTDLEQGALYWIAASIFSVIIPVFPLVSLYQHWFKDEHDDSIIVPRPDDTAVYAMLIWVGIAFTIGSFLCHRAVRHPAVPPLFKWKHICTDELHAMWWFFFGTLPSVPITAIYCYHNGAAGQYGLALALSIICSVIMELAVFASYPPENGQPHREFFAPWVFMCFSKDSVIGKYCYNDWLIICWGFLFVSVLANVMAFVILMYYCGRWDPNHNNTGAVGHELYNFGTGLFDTLLFTMGCLYMVAGSTKYHDVGRQHSDIESQEIDYVNVISLQSEASQHSQNDNKPIRKPVLNEPLSVTLMHGPTIADQQSVNVLRIGSVRKDSPPAGTNISNGDEPFDEIPPPEEEVHLSTVSFVPGSNRYSLARGGDGKEYSL